MMRNVKAIAAAIPRPAIVVACAYPIQPAYPMWPQATIGAGKGAALPLNPAQNKSQAQ